MTQQSLSPTDQKLRQALFIEAKKLIVTATYAGQGHLEESTRWVWWDAWLGVPATLGTTLLAAGASVSALLDAQPLVTATIALLATACSTVRVFFKTEDLTQSHGLKGNQYLSLRNEARIFKDLDLLAAVSAEELQAASKTSGSAITHSTSCRRCATREIRMRGRSVISQRASRIMRTTRYGRSTATDGNESECRL